MSAIVIPAIFKAIDQITIPTRGMGASVVSFATKSQVRLAKLNRTVNKLTPSFGKLGSQIGIFGGIALAGTAIRSAIQDTIELDDAVSAAAAKFGVLDRSSVAFKQLEERAREMGSTTRFSAGEAAEGLKNLATSGFTAEQAMIGLPTVLALAASTQSDLAISSDLAAKSLAAFGLRSDDPLVLAKNLDMVAGVFNKLITTTGFGSLDEFMTTIGRSGATAKSAGIDIQTWGTIVGATVSEAKDASTAGTEFANAISQLAKNSKQFKKFGVNIEDDKGDFRDFIDILADVEKRTAKLGQVQKAAKLGQLFGKQGAKTIQILLAKGSDSLRKFRKDFEGSAQLTAKMASFMDGSFGGLIKSMQSGLSELGISFIKTFQDDINAGLVKVTEMVRAIGAWVRENKELIKTVFKIGVFLLKIFAALKLMQGILLIARGAMIAYNVVLGITGALSGTASVAIGANSIALGAYKVALFIATAAQTAFNLAMSLNPIVALIIGIIAAGALIIVFWDELKEFGGAAIDFISEKWGKLTDKFKEWKSLISEFDFGGFFSGMIDGLKSVGGTLLSAVLRPFQELLDIVAEFTGSEFLLNASANFTDFRSGLRGEDENGTDALLNPRATDAITRNETFESLLSEQRISLDINDNTGGNVALTENPSSIPVNISSTFPTQ